MIPVKLTLTNFISHIHSVLDFTKISCALVVGSYEGNSNIANGVGKCLPYYTRIYDKEKKEIVSIKQFVEEKRRKILGLKNCKNADLNVINWINCGPKEIFSVKLSNGMEFEAPLTHPILTPYGCKSIKNLKIGDWVAEIRKIDFDGNVVFNEDEITILGLMIGDGCLTNKISLSNTNVDIINKFKKSISSLIPAAEVVSYDNKNHIIKSIKAIRNVYKQKLIEFVINNGNIDLNKYRICKKHFFSGKSTLSYKTILKIEQDFKINLSEFKKNLWPIKFLIDFFKKYSLYGKDSQHKILDNKLLSMQDLNLGPFLSNLWNTDGHVYIKNSHIEVSYLSKSFQLIKDIRFLLLRLDIQSYISEKIIRGEKYYNLIILINSIEKFHHLVSLVEHKQKILNNIVMTIKNRNKNENIDVIPSVFNRYLSTKTFLNKKRTLEQLNKYNMSRQNYLNFGGLSIIGKSDIFWTKIKSIEPTKHYVDCYDIEVDSDEHLYIADTIICHNSSLMDAIRFALFGKTKFNVKTKMVKRGKEFCQVEFIFLINDEVYKIIRKLSAKTGIITIDFFKKENNVWVSSGLTCDTPTQTNNKIIEIVGMNDDTFVNISYFRQNDVSGFTSANATKRKEILKEGLKIGIWDEYQKISKDSEKQFNQQLEAIEERIKLLGNVEQDIEKAYDRIKEKQILLNKAQENLIEIEDSVKECNSNITDIEISIAKRGLINSKGLEAEIVNISKRGKEITSRKNHLFEIIKKNNEVLSNANNDCSNLAKRAIQYYKDILTTSYKNRDEFESEFKRFSDEKAPVAIFSFESLRNNREKREIYKKQLDELRFDLRQLTTLKPGKECPTCLSKIDNPDSILKRRATKKKFLESRILEQKSLLEEIDIIIQKEENILRKADESAVEVERTNLIIAKRMAVISEATNENQRIQKELKNLADEWQRLKDKKQEIFDILSSLNKKTNLNENLSNLFELRKDLELKENVAKEKVMKLGLECGSLEGYKEGLEKKFSEKQMLLDKKGELIVNIAVYSKLSIAFGKDGIQAIIMENITEDLRQYTNSILSNIYYKPISIDFVTQRQTGTGTWREDFEIVIMIDNETYDFEDISGGEQVRVSIALRLALSLLLMRRVGSNIQFLLFDEVDQSLDRHGLEALFETIKELSKDFKILVISHSEYMKEKFEHIITVHMGPTGSVLR
jgi:exonuclease SbcC